MQTPVNSRKKAGNVHNPTFLPTVSPFRIDPFADTLDAIRCELFWIYEIFSGLDPALPLFMSGDQATHLSAGDAKFVGKLRCDIGFRRAIYAFSVLSDVIHTDGGFLGIPWVWF